MSGLYADRYLSVGLSNRGEHSPPHPITTPARTGIGRITMRACRYREVSHVAIDTNGLVSVTGVALAR
jgi:hypothetical protein